MCHAAGVDLPVIDVSALRGGSDPSARAEVDRRLVAACEEQGFFLVVGHGIDPDLRADLDAAARAFFSLEESEKGRIAMARGGRAWRGWFPVGGELTSGVPDRKEGIYFGTELPSDDPRVRAGRPLHGPNLFPDRPAELGPLVLRWMDEVTALGRDVLSGIAGGLGIGADWFDRWCADPTVLFRIFHYPAAPADDGGWGVAEHTDYGLLTLLAQDATGGLEVRVDGAWVEVPPRVDAFVCNLGDMLERMTGGRFRSTPHRVGAPTADRCSFPLFLDPGWDVEVRPLPEVARAGGAIGPEPERWDGARVVDGDGTYGDYLTSRVARVFPELFDAAVSAGGSDPRG
jgi:isopenicillin N synthase-like dioxygenase